MAERGVLNNGDTIDYAMGQMKGVHKGLKIYGHGGADAGYRSILFRVPGEQFSVNILSNLSTFNPGSMGLKIIDIYLKNKEVNELPKQVEPKSDSGSVKVDPAILASYTGKYELQPGIIATILFEDNTLFAEAHELPKTPMIPLSETEFEVKPVQAKVAFQKDGNGNISGMLVNMQGQQIMAHRLPDFDPSTVTLAELTGEFYSSELNTAYTFVDEKGKLIARHFRTGDVYLTPSKADVFSGDKWYFSRVEFIRDGNNQVTGCKVGNGRVSNLKFDKVMNVSSN